MTWTLAAIQTILPFAPWILAGDLASRASAASTITAAEPPAKVNRTVPQVDPPSTEVRFSANPNDEEISRARIFGGPIVSTGKAASSIENKDLAVALLAYRNRRNPDDAGAIENFLRQHPDSPRYVSLTGHLAAHYRHTSQFSKAVDAWRQVWVAGKGITDLNGRQTVDQAVGEWAAFLLALGRIGEFKTLMQELKGRQLHGAAAVRIADAQDALYQLEHRPAQTYKCGPYALSRIQATLDSSLPISRHILTEESTTKGTSLYQNWLLAQKMGLKYQMARRQVGAVIPLPAMVHWKPWHFSALTKYEDGRYQIEDATATLNHNSISSQALDDEASGYFLIPDGPLPAGWSPVTKEEGETIFGKGSPNTSDDRAGGDGCNGPPPAGGYAEGGGKPCPPKGMAQYAFNMMRIGLEIADVPVGYTPPRGPEVEFRVTYSERTIYQTGPFFYANLGNQWTYEWLTYVKDDTTKPSDPIMVVDSAGTSESYTGYNTTNQTYAVETYQQGQMTKTSGSSYQCVYPDGSMRIFSQPDNTNGPRRVFLTRLQDPAGNALDFTYDGTNRLVAVKDAIGQVTRLDYELTNDVYKITKVTDPFGRYATFQYNAIGQLTNITDEIGITSSFAYGNSSGEADFINSLTTPYGTTTFSNSYSDSDFRGRWLVATDPLGGQERAQMMGYLAPAPWPSPLTYDPNNLIPSGYNSYDATYDEFNRMTFFWNKKTMQAMQGDVDFTKARQYLWNRLSGNYYSLSRSLQAIKQPMETARTWYAYPGQSSLQRESTTNNPMNKPTYIGRVLDDGTTQAQQYQYNPLGKPTVAIDPAGRTTYFTYAANNIDLLTVAQKEGSTTNTLARYTYNAQHLPLTAVDAAGNTNFFGYNTNGQLTALTNALNQVVQLYYDTNSYLTGISGPLGMTNSFTYDSYGRVRTVTDSEGYTVTTSYDNLDRPTRVDYMDGTYEQTTYNYLDVSLMRDRNGHWTKQMHDPLRHLTDIYDSIGRHTKLDWCTCGSLEGITDPMGKVTLWTRDIQNRVTAKIYPDLTQITYAYETNSSRLLKVTDAKLQSTHYRYYVDNNLKQVSYSNAVIATPSVNFTYDTNYNRLLTMVDGVGTNTYTYYPVATGQLGAGMLASVASTFTASTVTYNYDALGRITNRAIDGVAEQLTYDDLGRVTIITNALGGFTNTYLRATALITTNARPNGRSTTFSYLGVTNDQRLASIWNHNVDGSTLSKFDYAYDALGQITNWTQQTDSSVTNVQAIQYDPMNQLLAVTVRANTQAGAILKHYAYAYDASGNRTTEQIADGNSGSAVAISQSTYNDNNQLTGRTGGSGTMVFAGRTTEPATVTVGGNAASVNHQTTNFTATATVTTGTNTVSVVATDYSYNAATNKYQIIVTNNGVNKALTFDLNGNQTAVVTATSTNTYQWDAANRLLSISGPTNQSLFTYDGYGRRVQIIEFTNGVAASTNRYLWTGLHMIEQRTIAGAVTKRFFGQGEQISGTSYYFTRDHLGSIREMLDAAGNLQARYDYDPYGRRTKLSGSLDADFGYTGHFYHAASGLCLTLFRAYDPDLGRWLSRDPIEENGGLNLYSYVSGAPINFIDPLGLVCWGNLFSATAGIIGNGFGVVGGILLGVGTSWSGIGGVAGAVIGVKSAYGLVANGVNFVDALRGKNPHSTGALITDVLPKTPDWQNAGNALDLAVDLGGSRIAAGARTVTKAGKYGGPVLQGGAKLGSSFSSKNGEAAINTLTVAQVAQTGVNAATGGSGCN